MQASFYKQLQSYFARIRFLQYNSDQKQFDAVISSVKEARKKIEQDSSADEKRILLYCIDTLFEVLRESDPQKTFDYADAVHNIPEIYMMNRNLYSFRYELKSFQKKYGKQYFPFLDEIKPRFTRNAPKNKWEFFSAQSDVDFKLLHPVGYRLLVAAGMAALFLPMVIYIVCLLFVHPAPDDWRMILGLVGAFIVGVGLFNIVSAWIHQYLGHLLTVVCLTGGTAIVLFSLHLLCT